MNTYQMIKTDVNCAKNCGNMVTVTHATIHDPTDTNWVCKDCQEWVRPEGYYGPSKFASSRCESGGRNFCTCDVCF